MAIGRQPRSKEQSLVLESWRFSVWLAHSQGLTQALTNLKEMTGETNNPTVFAMLI